MSELKYYKLFHRASALTSPQFISVVEFGNGDEVYLKSEADKVIAEKDAEIVELKAQKAQAEDDCAYWKMNEGNAANAMHETEEYAMQLYNEVRHQKYKRCLAMASTCRLRARWFGDNSFYKKEQWALQWHRRWLELAEKFKPNKEADDGND